MSWQSYVDNLLAADHHGNQPIEEAAICGATSGEEAVWASSPGLASISAAEIKKLLLNDRSSLFQNGVHIGGMKCRVLRDMMHDDIPFMDMKTAHDPDGNTYSICVGKSKKALVIGKGKKDAPGGQVNNKVSIIADYLRKANI